VGGGAWTWWFWSCTLSSASPGAFGRGGAPAAPGGAALRPASPQDVSAIARIERASFGDPWSEDAFRELLRIPSAIFLVATKGSENAVTGYIVAAVASDQAEILNLAVNPSERRGGLGGELLDAVSGALVARGAREVFLDVRESNVAALALYRSRGFTSLSRRRNYYRNPVEDALVLRRAIER
jgi:[ribosomal protein S18]-alanine N-acetyltransferase